MRILVVYWWPPGRDVRVAVEQHLRALDGHVAAVDYLNAADGQPPRGRRRGRYDGVVLHTTFLCLRWSRDFSRARRTWAWLGELGVPVVALPQDDYDHAEVLDEWLDSFGAGTIYPIIPEVTWPHVYPRSAERARLVLGLTGHLNRSTASYFEEHHRPLAERPLDLVYRAQRLPYWFGSHGQLKHRIGVEAKARAVAHRLAADVSTDPADAIMGTAWLDFVLSGRATVGAESGSSVLDRRGEVQRRIRELLAVDPSLTLEEVDRLMPPGWDSYAFFMIGPRHFEAVLARTAQVLVEGTYSGVLEPERHYIPVKRDLSDLDDALERLHDLRLLEEMTERAHREIYLEGAWTTDDFARDLRRSLETGRRRRPRKRPSARVDVPRLPPPAESAGRLLLVAANALARRPRLVLLLLRQPVTAARAAPAVGRDLVRLGLLDRFEERQRRHGGPWHVDASVAHGTLRLASVRDRAAGEAVPRGDVARVEWDNRAYGATFSLAPGSKLELPVTLGDDGVYRFDGLSRLAAARPGSVWTRAVVASRRRPRL